MNPGFILLIERRFFLVGIGGEPPVVDEVIAHPIDDTALGEVAQRIAIVGVEWDGVEIIRGRARQGWPDKRPSSSTNRPMARRARRRRERVQL